VVDISHEVQAQNIDEGAAILAAACPVFPAGTVHVGVVDPGVGTERDGLVIQAGGHWLVGPDNGLFAPVVRRLGAETACAYRIENRDWMRSQISATFHGRDVFAPVAGMLSRGEAIAEVGSLCAGWKSEALAAVPEQSDGGWRGQVVTVDGFGNLITNIPGELLGACSRIAVGGVTLHGLVRTYGDAPDDAKLVALIGSEGLLEIAAPGGSGATVLGVGVGAVVEVWGT
jgi:hypothetical protein